MAYVLPGYTRKFIQSSYFYVTSTVLFVIYTPAP